VLTYIEERSGTEFEPEASTAFVKLMRKVDSGVQRSPMPPLNGAEPVDAPPVEARSDSAPPAPPATPPKPPEGSA
jgi:hypothetical protein